MDAGLGCECDSSLPIAGLFRTVSDGHAAYLGPKGFRPPRRRKWTAAIRGGCGARGLALWADRQRQRAEFLLTLDDAKASLARGDLDDIEGLFGP